jgi:hypothetical protein
VWNIYKTIYKNGNYSEERWTGNSGFWIENIDANTKIYHCSSGNVIEPDFENLVFSLSILG